MGGGGSNNKKKFNKPKTRKPTKKSSPSLFVEGGLLSDWSPIITSPPSKGKSNTNSGNKSKNTSAVRFEIGSTSGGKSKVSKTIESKKPKKNVFVYEYPQGSPYVDEGGDRHNKFDESNPIVLVDCKESKIVAYMDQSPVMNPETVKYTYDYGASFEVDYSSHLGLGFHEEAEENPIVIEESLVTEQQDFPRFDSSSAHEMETDMMDDDASDVDASSSPVTNSGFLSIGGMKLYTHDLSYDEEEDDDDEESVGPSESEDSSNSSDSDGAYNSYSDLNDEIARDYFEGIGGSYKAANVDNLIGQALDSSDDDNDFNGGRYNEMIKGVSGIALKDASREYGMKNSRSKNKSRANSRKFVAATDDWSAIDDLMLVKNSRSLHGKKKHAAKLPQSWPSKAETSQSFQRFSGEKKKLRQDKIASKRRERMISRGVDLEKINFKLEQMVKNRGDIMSFQLMHSRDCSQVQRLAAIYHLRSGSQGSGRKRFVTVTRTQHTCMPSPSDRVRLEKLLGIGDDGDDDDMKAGKTPSNKSKKSGLTSLDSKVAKSKASGDSSRKKRRDKEKEKTGSYAAQPVSFISSGNMITEPAKGNVVDQTLSSNKPVASSSSNYGAFEMHTTGFGSRMMAKMGYVDGGGLGKDGKGIAEPIEAIQRPKSLGLGAKIPETSNTSEVPMNATPRPQKPNRLVGQGSRSSESKGKSGNVEFGLFEKHTKGFGSKRSESKGKSGNVEFGLFEKHTKGNGSKSSESKGKSGNVEFGLFEKHTKGFGARSSDSKGKSGNVEFGVFEKHTKGFGSKMMAKMGFVEGMGLGRDSQGIVQPLVASRLPKSRGLGAKG